MNVQFRMLPLLNYFRANSWLLPASLSELRFFRLGDCHDSRSRPGRLKSINTTMNYYLDMLQKAQREMISMGIEITAKQSQNFSVE